MNKRLFCVCAVLALVAAPRLAAGQSWDGTWKINMAKSKIIGDTYTVEDKGNGKMHYTGGSIAYDFACDGKPYTFVADRTDTCTGSPEAGYDDVIKAGDKVIARVHSVFSAEGKTLTAHETDIRPDGTTSDSTTVYRRQSGTSGLVGKWLDVKTEAPSDSIMMIQTKGDWIEIHNQQYKTTIEGKMDGSALNVTGPDIPPGVTQSVTRDGPNKLRQTAKYKDKVMAESVQTLSADGKTIVEETWTPGKMDEKATYVWERQ